MYYFAITQYICNMTKEHLYESFSISYETLDVYKKQEHQHSFFELVYILSEPGSNALISTNLTIPPGICFCLHRRTAIHLI